MKIYDACKEAELPEPEIKEFQGGFLVTLFKDNLTEDQLAKLGLNDRQLKAVNFVKEKGRITNSEYQELFDVSKATATRDLTEHGNHIAINNHLSQLRTPKRRINVNRRLSIFL